MKKIWIPFILTAIALVFIAGLRFGALQEATSQQQAAGVPIATTPTIAVVTFPSHVSARILSFNAYALQRVEVDNV